jgi:hypothetical protein
MDQRGCAGVRLRAGDLVTVTGRAYVTGIRIYKTESRRRLERAGAGFSDDWSEHIATVIWGEFSPAQIINPARGLTEKLENAWAARRVGRHVHVVDTGDYAELLAGQRVPCRPVPDPEVLRRGWPEARRQLRQPVGGRREAAARR